METLTPDRILGPEEAAALLNCHPNHIRNLIQRGGLPGFRLGKLYRISEARLRQWMQEQETTRNP